MIIIIIVYNILVLANKIIEMQRKDRKKRGRRNSKYDGTKRTDGGTQKTVIIGD